MFIVEKKPQSIFAESYRTLRTNIQYSSFDKDIKIIVVTSSEAGEGKSTTAGNLALAFAEAKKRTILIDCNLRNPTLNKQFKTSGLLGLSDILIGKNNIYSAIHKHNEYLSVMTSGTIPPNPAEMLSSRTMEKLLQELKEHFQIIILDSSALNDYSDAQILSTKADGVILVVKARKTKRNKVFDAKALLDKVGVNLLGVVLNEVKSRKKEGKN
ncbi:CpsD/CapB family tyrosine-protein kinase [Clostridium sp. SHJSY1]|uniref:CpsD/CapB family tyrosine-protein kinase n=1 Tax=Clostridium sp. SHJSY1 TaxID=2942483 RepID=UPI00287654D7|nr:CpsD/CapB family tyrosine-protein kinase [Clostridium sp. SHJSY1]MDS0526644.1 CpsD/CapB family tyrosine-protein kinase [Clostridium sp. SHJSY1]